MKKIILLASISFLLIQCKKQESLPELSSTNDYKLFELVDRVCEVNQKVTLLEKTNYSINDKSQDLVFDKSGHLVLEKIYNQNDSLIEENTYLQQAFPLLKKQFITPDIFVSTQTTYDSLKNILKITKATKNGQMIEEQQNTLSDNFIIREDYFSSGKNGATKTVEINRNGDVIKNKVIYSKQRTVLDSIVYEYKNKQIISEIHYNASNQISSSLKYTYSGDNIASTVYLDELGNEEAVEKFKYNENNKLIYKSAFSAIDNSTYEESFVYNSDNNLEQSTVKLNGKNIISTTQKYDSLKNLINFESTNFTNKESLTRTYSYTYDKRKNWLTKEVSINNIPTYKVSREIKYCN